MPRALHQLATLDELNSWLCRVLFSILVPGTVSQTMVDRIYSPNNLVAFMDLLIHLDGVGFPSHWLSGFLSNIVWDRLSSDVAPYKGQLPIPVSERNRHVSQRKVNLSPWSADLENILAVSYEALPFTVPRPTLFATSVNDLVTFEVPVHRHMCQISTALNRLNVFYPVVALMFFKAGAYEGNRIVSRVDDILEGKTGTGGSIQILTMVEKFDVTIGRIQWRLGRRRAEQMKAEGWVMCPYRFDGKETGE